MVPTTPLCVAGFALVPKHGPQLYEFASGHDHITITATATGEAGKSAG